MKEISAQRIIPEVKGRLFMEIIEETEDYIFGLIKLQLRNLDK